MSIGLIIMMSHPGKKWVSLCWPSKIQFLFLCQTLCKYGFLIYNTPYWDYWHHCAQYSYSVTVALHWRSDRRSNKKYNVYDTFIGFYIMTNSQLEVVSSMDKSEWKVQTQIGSGSKLNQKWSWSEAKVIPCTKSQTGNDPNVRNGTCN